MGYAAFFFYFVSINTDDIVKCHLSKERSEIFDSGSMFALRESCRHHVLFARRLPGQRCARRTWHSDEWQGMGCQSHYFTRHVYVGFYASNHVEKCVLHSQCCKNKVAFRTDNRRFSCIPQNVFSKLRRIQRFLIVYWHIVHA